VPLQVADPMPRTPMFDPGAWARLNSSAQHPSSRGPVAHLVDVETPYQALVPPEDAVWPRATVRPLPLMRGQRNWWAAKIWDAPGVPAYVDPSYKLDVVDGCWVSANFATIEQAMDWANSEIERRRPKADPSNPLEPTC
jgi:hypothetical protein